MFFLEVLSQEISSIWIDLQQDGCIEFKDNTQNSPISAVVVM